MSLMANDQRTTKDISPGNAVLEGYREKGLAGRVGFGLRPAVLVIDFITGFTDIESPLGSDLDSELEACSRLLEVARDHNVAVFFTTTVYQQDMVDAGLFVGKVPSLAILQRDSNWVQVDARLGVRDSEPIIEKRYASAFFGTHLASTLTAAGIDTLIVTGCTTSGCVRASVVDALQYGFRAIVPPECVGDRSAQQHAANLVDIDAKYGDVVDLPGVIEYLEGLETER
jgi:nicotinamidase-related amidase